MTTAPVIDKLRRMAKRPISKRMDRPLSALREAFCRASVDPNCPSQLAAYERAGYKVAGRSIDAVRSDASALARDPVVVARIKELQDMGAKAAVMDAAAVLREWVAIATADPSELHRIRRFACRRCHGIDHQRQWVDETEYAYAIAETIDYNAHKSARKAQRPMPDARGGYGYSKSLEPVPTCPACMGDGEWDDVMADTRKLSPGGRKLFAGIRMTKMGPQVMMRDQDGALANIAKYLGMLAERHLLGGDPNNPTPIPTLSGTMSAQEASQLYAATMNPRG